MGAQEKPSDETPREQEKSVTGLNHSTSLTPKNFQSPNLDKPTSLSEKTFETHSSSFGKEALGFEKKFETPEASFNKTYPMQSKSYEVKSSDLGKSSSLQNKQSDLTDKNTSGLDKKFETKAYEGPETPQANREISDILRQKGGDPKAGDRPLTIQEVKQIVNRDSHRVEPKTPRVEVPKESAKDSEHSTP
jgi:hypothetical protein